MHCSRVMALQHSGRYALFRVTMTSFPRYAFAIAAVTCLVLALQGVDWILALVLLIVWTGTVWLVAAKPPPVAERDTRPAFSHDMMGELIEHSQTPIVVTERGRIAIANDSARNLLGAHIVGQDARMALRQPEAVRLLEDETDGAAVVRGLARRRDIWRVNRKQLGSEMAVIEFVNKTAEADISRAHTDFVANASHELRTPLASILGYVETLRDDGAALDTPIADKFLGTIQREARRLQDLVSDLMSLSRIEAEKHEMPSEEIMLGPLVERAARDGAGAQRIDRLHYQCEGEFTIRGDAQQLEQLVRNLVDNAFKYGAADGEVTVRLEPSNTSKVMLSVQDRGDGIDPEHLPHLTRRFYRTDPGRSRASGGTGLGLAIVKHIVERHRGRLDIESVRGEGTVFKVRMPLVTEN